MHDNASMDITLHGATLRIPDHCSIATLLDLQSLADRRVAVEVNGSIVPRAAHATHLLAAGDSVEVVQALGGG